MDPQFTELKKKSKSGELFESYASHMRYNLGTHKKTRLKKAGLELSGSLLHDRIAKEHGEKLFKELHDYSKNRGKAADSRLRFMTVLHSVVEPEVATVEAAVEQFTATYKEILGSLGLWSLGAIELEMVNFDILERISQARNDEARKLNVLSNLSAYSDFRSKLKANDRKKTKVLVHCHVVVDLGEDFTINEQLLRNLIIDEPGWNRSVYQVEIKGLFKNRKTSKNLKAIAAYVTKGGNESLRYNAGFGRDLAEDLEAKIWREGLGRSGRGGETIEDERGLTVGELRQLDALYCWLMGRRSDGRGYVLSSGVGD
jgi:hypothetical protein